MAPSTRPYRVPASLLIPVFGSDAIAGAAEKFSTVIFCWITTGGVSDEWSLATISTDRRWGPDGTFVK